MLVFVTDAPLDILTGGLAVITAATAVVGMVAAKAARRAADIAQASLAASVRPVIADVPQDLFASGGERDRKSRVKIERSNGAWVISAPVRNAGLGPAFLVSAVVAAMTEAPAGQCVTAEANPTHRVLPPGETTLVLCKVNPKDPAFEAMNASLAIGFHMLIRYTDLAGHQRTLTTFYVTCHEGQYFARGVDVSECDERWQQVGEPVIARGPVEQLPAIQRASAVDGPVALTTLLDDLEEVLARNATAAAELRSLQERLPLLPDVERYRNFVEFARQHEAEGPTQLSGGEPTEIGSPEKSGDPTAS